MRLSFLGASLLLAACGSDVTPAEQEQLDREAIAEVEANQTPPPDIAEPQPLNASDLESERLLGMGCRFVPESGGNSPIAVALAGDAYMKMDDAIDRFAVDAGSPDGPFGTRQKYDSGRYSMVIELTDGTGEKVGSETIGHAARLTLRDGRDRMVYEARGTALCGA